MPWWLPPGRPIYDEYPGSLSQPPLVPDGRQGTVAVDGVAPLALGPPPDPAALTAGLSPVMVRALRLHWPEYLMEAAALGAFMVSACAFGALLWHPGSPASGLVADGAGRRALMGLAMGTTAVGII